MGKFDDFDLDVTKTAAQGGIEPKRYTSTNNKGKRKIRAFDSDPCCYRKWKYAGHFFSS